MVSILLMITRIIHVQHNVHDIPRLIRILHNDRPPCTCGTCNWHLAPSETTLQTAVDYRLEVQALVALPYTSYLCEHCSIGLGLCVSHLRILSVMCGPRNQLKLT